jgi:hypothetical protein
MAGGLFDLVDDVLDGSRRLVRGLCEIPGKSCGSGIKEGGIFQGGSGTA